MPLSAVLSTVYESDVGAPLIAELKQGDVKVHAICVPPTERSWSLDPLYKVEDADRASLIAALNKELGALGVVRAYAPAAHLFSGKIASACELRQVIGLGDLSLYYDHRVPADGVPLEVGEAFVCGMSGCAATIAIGEGKCTVAHAGRDSLIDRKRYEGMVAGRTYMSVVDEMAEAVRNWHISLARTAFHALFYLPPESFGHPLADSEGARYHRAIREYVNEIRGNCAQVKEGHVHLDIGTLAVVQARRAGFGIARTSHALPMDGPFAYTRHRDAEMRKKCNLVIVHRIS